MGKVRRINRAEIKTPEHALMIELQKEYNFPPIMARALMERINKYVDDLSSDEHHNNQIIKQAIHINEPSGKPLSKCRMVPVKLTMTGIEDARILATQGATALKKVRVKRWFEEAYEQGGLLTHEDVAVLLGSDISTVKRLVKQYKNEGVILPTRGQIRDIGPGISHKAQIIELYLKGYTITEIEKRLIHTPVSIERYLLDFSRILTLRQFGLSPAEIRLATDLSEHLIEEYLELAQKYQQPHQLDRIAQLQGKFSPLLKEPPKKGGS